MRRVYLHSRRSRANILSTRKYMPPKIDTKIASLKKQLDVAKQEQKLQKLVASLKKKSAKPKKKASKPKTAGAKSAAGKKKKQTAGGEKTVKVIVQLVGMEKKVVPAAAAAPVAN